MLSVEPTGKILGATVRGVNLSHPLSDRDFGKILKAFGDYGLLRFPDQTLSAPEHAAFMARFGEIHGMPDYKDVDSPDVNLVSNIIEDGRNIGHPDAGMIWHKDMTYTPVAGYATSLHAFKVPRRDGKALGGTRFISEQAATDDLPADILEKLRGTYGLHSVEKFNSVIRQAGSSRKTYSDIPEDRKRPVRAHPMLLTHPVSGKTVLYCDFNHIESIYGLEPKESEELLAFLAEHQLKPKYLYTHVWSEGDLVMWDNLSTLHCATPDYTADEPRLLKRCQAMSDKVRNRGFVKAALAAAA